jgi:hypothetical protein
MDKVQKHNSFNTNTPSSESYRKHSSCFTSDGKGYLIGDSVGPRAGPNVVTKIKCHVIPQSRSPLPVTKPAELSRLIYIYIERKEFYIS